LKKEAAAASRRAAIDLENAKSATMHALADGERSERVWREKCRVLRQRCDDDVAVAAAAAEREAVAAAAASSLLQDAVRTHAAAAAGVGSKCSCDVHLCSLHSVRANLMINMHFCFYSGRLSEMRLCTTLPFLSSTFICVLCTLRAQI
jgi:hypothetical protein